ncbi:MAG: hypothetical protein UEP80_07630 [Senegalimassilia anaerobia]|nr:hypothetical protein [Senegalimassilia anaerobia]
MRAEELRAKLESRKDRSAWDRGVTTYAVELVETIEADAIAWANWGEAEKAMLNGAKYWKQYSYGGCSLVYDCDIAERLCTPSELKKKRGGELPPNSGEEWLDVQARALYQAARRVYRASRGGN